MSLEPTEELFDLLMQGFSTEVINSDCEDEDDETEQRCEIINQQDSEEQSSTNEDVIELKGDSASSNNFTTLNSDAQVDEAEIIDDVEKGSSNLEIANEDNSNNFLMSPNSKNDSICVIVSCMSLKSFDSPEKNWSDAVTSDDAVVVIDNDDGGSSNVLVVNNTDLNVGSDVVGNESRDGLNCGSVDSEPLGTAVDLTNTDDCVETITVDIDRESVDDGDEITVKPHSDSAPSNCSPPTKSVDMKCDASSVTESVRPQETLEKVPTDAEKIGIQNYLKRLQCFINSNYEKHKSIEGEPGLKSFYDDDKEAINLGLKCYQCTSCNAKFWIRHFYREHMMRVTSYILYNCKHCNKRLKFSNPCLLKLHMASHGINEVEIMDVVESKIKIKAPPMDQFKNKYLSESSFPIDRFFNMDVSNHGQSTMLKCPECKKQISSLVDHLMFIPKCNTIFKCPHCTFLFSSRCSLKMHERIHSMKKPYLCPECGTQFVTRDRLLLHLNEECFHLNRSISYQCSMCRAIFCKKITLQNHILHLHHVKVYKCYFCPKLFKMVSSVQLHVRTEHSDQDASNMKLIVMNKCDMCCPSLVIFQLFKFKNHIMDHIQQCLYYGFKCKNCKYQIQNPIKFQKHMENKKCQKVNAFSIEVQCGINYVPAKRKCLELQDPQTVKKMFSIYKNDSNMDEAITSGIIATSLESKAEAQRKSTLKRQKAAERFKDGTNQKSNSFNNSINTVTNSSNNYENKTILQPKNTATKMSQISVNFKPEAFKYACSICQRQFVEISVIKTHLKEFHNCTLTEKYIHIVESNKSAQNNIESNDTIRNNDLECLTTCCYYCPYCNYEASSDNDFKSHVTIHRSDDAYQCLECGECFVYKDPLEIHLLSVHFIKDTAGYISSNYVHNSLPKPEETVRDVEPNQCTVCFNIFPDSKALQLHFRSHGMAFLRQNFAKKISS